MFSYILIRSLSSLVTLLVVCVVAFGIVHFTPGNPASIILGEMATAAEVEALSERLGLNRPMAVQFVDWLTDLARGDLGESLFFDESVLSLIWSRREPTLLLLVLSLTIATLIGVPAGIFAALRRNTFGDQFFSVFALLGVAVPNFWLGLMLILVFSVSLNLFPSGGYREIADVGLWPAVRHMILPSLTLGFAEAALISRVTRAAFLEVSDLDFVRTATSKGLPRGAVVLKHVLRNALIPIITVIALSAAALLGGAVVTETVFTLPGIGRLVITSVSQRDYPVVQGIVLLAAVAYVVINLLVDLCYAFIDPRVEY